MLLASPAPLLLLLIVVSSTALMLIRPREIAEVWWVGGGAVLLVVFRLIPWQLAARAVGEGTDVYLFLIGMMLLSEAARENGVFDWVSAQAVKHAQGRTERLFLLIYGIGSVVTVCMSNDATAVVLTPAVLSAVRKARVEPRPHLFACAMIANAASFVLPISNPANLVVFHTGMPPLGRWLLSFLLPSVLSILATFAVLRWTFRQELKGATGGEAEATALTSGGKAVLWGLLLVVAVLLVMSALHVDLGLPTCVAAVAIAAWVSWRERQNPLRLAREISWSTLLLVAGLFVLVQAVETLHALRYTVAALAWVRQLPVVAGTAVLGFGLGIANNLVNNLPLGLIAGATVQASQVHGLLANAILIGVDLGPNLSVTGSLATILWLLAMRKEGVEVSAMDFLKIGLLAMPAAMLASLAGLLLMHVVAKN